MYVTLIPPLSVLADAACCISFSTAGMVMIYALPHHARNAKLSGFCLAMAFAANMPLCLSMVASNVGGFSKKATVNAMVFIAYCTGNIVRPQFYLTFEASLYPTGFKASLAGFCLGTFWLICLGAYDMWENRRRDGRAAGPSLSTAGEQDAAALSARN